MKSENINPVNTSGAHQSLWLENAEGLHFEPLRENLQCDVVIIGGGIAGLNVAYGLLETGKKIVLVEDGHIGSGETGRTSAHLTSALDDRYYEIEKIFGEDGARLAAESHTAAIDFIKNIVEKESLKCEFRNVPGYLFLHDSDEKESLKKEFNSAEKAGLNVRMLDKMPGFLNEKSCIEFRDQAQFHPVKYISGLAAAVQKRGGRIFTHTHASEIDENGITTADGFTVKAKYIVVATNAPVNSRLIMPLKQFPFRTYIIAVTIKKDSLPKALWWDTGNFDTDSEIPPYHYLRTESYDDHFDLLIVGGEDHATGLADAQKISEEERYTKLEKWLKNICSFEKVVYRWSGQVMEPVDCMGYIGHNPMDKKNIFIVTGDSGNGLTHAGIAGILIPDLINEKENRWETLYDPARIKLRSLSTWIKEFGTGFFDYLKHNPHHAKEVSLNSIKEGEGKIIQLDKEKYGAYRDKEGRLHFVAAECTHLKCIVKWNNDEKSWDCPCHGSRFTYDGKVMNGPANENLFYWSEQEKEFKKMEGRM